MVDQVVVGREYVWTHDGKTERVIVRDEPFMTAYESRPAPGQALPKSVLHCEVEIASSGELLVAPLEELSVVT